MDSHISLNPKSTSIFDAKKKDSASGALDNVSSCTEYSDPIAKFAQTAFEGAAAPQLGTTARETTAANTKRDDSKGSYDGGGSFLTMDDVFSLHSNPDADHTIYLDFDGHTITGTQWNNQYGSSVLVSPQWNVEGDVNTFTQQELDRIVQAYERVAEDFAPFNVNVTTEEPELAMLENSGAGDSQWGIRVVITQNAWAQNCNCGGHAYIDSFNWSNDTPALVYNSSPGSLAMTISHEVGHAINLSHDGLGVGNATYYSGHDIGNGPGRWGALMGAPFGAEVTHWDDGEYFDANNVGDSANFSNGQSDLDVITSLNGFGFREDDHGDEIAEATVLTTNQGQLDQDGIISMRDDQDMFRFETDAGEVNILVNSFSDRPNLNLWAGIYNPAGDLIAESNPNDSMEAGFVDLDLQAGTYYLKVDGVGSHGVYNPDTDSVEDPEAPPWAEDPPTGYSDYGSLGFYNISGNIVVPYDLVGATFTPQQFAYSEGEQINIDWSISNLGTFEARNVAVGFYISRDENINPNEDRLLGVERVDVAGFSTTDLMQSSFDLPMIGNGFWDLDSGYTVGMVIDRRNDFDEKDEGNNFNTAVGIDHQHVAVSHQPNTFHFRGTNGDDTFTKRVASDSYRITVNDVNYEVAKRFAGDIGFDGLMGNDQINVWAGTGEKSVVLNPMMGTLKATSYTTEFLNMETIDIDAQGGSSIAVLNDSMLNETVHAGATRTRMSSAMYTNTVRNFEDVRAIATVGFDRINFADSAGRDRFDNNGMNAWMKGRGFKTYGENFDDINATAFNGGADYAVLRDSAGDDSMSARPDFVSLISDEAGMGGVNVSAENFERVKATSSGGNDEVLFQDTSGNDTFVATETMTRLSGNGFFNIAVGFANSVVHSTGGRDIAHLSDTSANDSFEIGPNTSYHQSANFTNIMRNFARVNAKSRMGSDSIVIKDSVADSIFVSRENFSVLKTIGFIGHTKGFANVHTTSGGGVDRAEFYGSSMKDSFNIKPSISQIKNAAYTNVAEGFREVYAAATIGGDDEARVAGGNGRDTMVARAGLVDLTSGSYRFTMRAFAKLQVNGKSGINEVSFYGTSGDDVFEARTKSSTMKGDGYSNTAIGFETVTAYGNGDGDDKARLYGSAGNDRLESYYNRALYSGKHFNYEARLFDQVITYANGGGNDQAMVYDSSGKDTLLVKDDLVKLEGVGFDNRNIGFDVVEADAVRGGFDEAFFIDTDGNDTFMGQRSWGKLITAGTQVMASRFFYVTANAKNGGTDTLDIKKSIRYEFTRKGSWER